MRHITRRLRSAALTLRQRALAAFGLTRELDYCSGKVRVRSLADKQRDPPPEPPWMLFPGEHVDWGGFRQGNGHAWLLDVWLPFWRSLSTEQRASYLERWPPPDEDWCAAVTRM